MTAVSECVPQILQDIVSFLKEQSIKISDKIEGEGRGGSLKDEGSIKTALWNSPYKFKFIFFTVIFNF